jgi:nucleoid DNA-binding protein
MARADQTGLGTIDRHGGRVSVELAHARGSHLRWVLIGGGLGIACVLALGTLGKALGVVLLLLAAWAAFKLAMTFRHPPGTIVVDGDDVTLPRGLCRGEPNKLARKDVARVLESLSAVGYKELKKNGLFVLPGFAKFVVIKKPATKARKGINPFTKEPMTFKAKPARKVLKARPVKAAKDAL